MSNSRKGGDKLLNREYLLFHSVWNNGQLGSV